VVTGNMFVHHTDLAAMTRAHGHIAAGGNLYPEGVTYSTHRRLRSEVIPHGA
jgi:hypothetical protein